LFSLDVSIVKEGISGSQVYTNGHFCVEPCVTCFVPGYLIVTPQLPAASLSELGRDALASLGPTLAAVTRAIEVVIRPERVYCALFAEETRSVHFHLFPRSAWLLSQYATAHPADYEISGPRLLDWRATTLKLFKRFFVNSTAPSNKGAAAIVETSSSAARGPVWFFRGSYSYLCVISLFFSSQHHLINSIRWKRKPCRGA